MKRFLALITALVLCLGTMAFTSAVAEEEKLTLKVMVSIRDIDTLDFEDNWAVKWLEEKTGVHVEYEAIKEADWDTKFTLAMASGELPDVIWARRDINDEEYGVVQQLVIPVDELIPQYMPTLHERMQMDTAALGQLYASDGHIYGLPFYYFGTPCSTHDGIPFIQTAWLDKLGLEMPTTVDELTEVLRAFKTGDPNGNGIADEIPFSSTIIDGANCSAYVLFSFFGVPTDGNTFFTLNEEGKVTFDPYRPGFRAALEWLNQLYAEGLMDVETLTQDVATCTSKIGENVVGFFPFWRLSLMNVDAAYETCGLLLPPAAEGYEPKMHTNISLAPPGIYITKDNKHVEETLRWLDAQLDLEAMMNMYAGPEGGFWHWEEDGMATYTAPKDFEKLCLNVNAFLYNPGPFYRANINMSPAYVEKTIYTDALYAGGYDQKYPNSLLKCVNITPDEAYETGLILPDVQTTVKEFVSKSITDGVTDESWNAFMDNCSKLRIDEYLTIYQNALDASGLIK